MQIKIGTRGSKLALWQAEYVATLLQKQQVQTEIIPIETKGDKILDKSLSKIGSKGIFTAELEEQLRDHSIDIAVHSAKDMQSCLEDDLELIAFTTRERANDVVISFNQQFRLHTADYSFLIGTSSTRRTAMLKHYYPQIKTMDVRGNLQTRMKKLEQGDFDALILAYAGVKRMGLDRYIVEELSLDKFTPAVGQGSIAIESAKSLSKAKKDVIRQALNHLPTETCLLAERAFLKTLEGGCSIPVFGLAVWEGERISLTGGIISLDGKKLLRQTQQAPPLSPEDLGKSLAETLLKAGADQILQQIRAKQKKSE
jgi:hydroxymethylbilane synthase